ncbi:MAG: hypothetical protein ABI639_06165 [Thermoanaerobaculia bacterium]
MRNLRRSGLFVVLAVFFAGASFAGTLDKTAAFKIGEWIDLASSDGPVTLHRVRLVHESGFTKSSFIRPGNSQYLDDVQIQLEFSNDASKDWEARITFEWTDSDGNVIDGYKGKEGLDSEKKHDVQTMTLSTLKYGLEHAKKVTIHIDYELD